MDFVKQAFALNNTDKNEARRIYEEAVRVLVHKDYVSECKDAHTELSAIFGVRWLMQHRLSESVFFSATQYAKANVAFNYANFVLGSRRKFVNTVKRICNLEECKSEAELNVMAEEMDCILTCTTAQQSAEAL